MNRSDRKTDPVIKKKVKFSSKPKKVTEALSSYIFMCSLRELSHDESDL